MEASKQTFFSGIKQAITANPFSQEREAIDQKLAGLKSKRSADETIQKLLHEVERNLAEFDTPANISPSAMTADDGLLRYGHLFLVFHRFIPHYDQHIEEQVRHGDNPCPVTFGPDILRQLHEFGITGGEALRFLALFFQMRRAFFFISKIAGKSECVQELRKRLWNNIFTEDIELYEAYLWDRMEDFSTMLLGETGTGKGLAAAAIGRSGYIPFNEKSGCFAESFAKSFVSINLSQYQEQLIESELFGHQKGSFTGAIEDHKGIFSRCSPFGAIFIDEIGDVSIPIQIKLLQVLQERTFTPVGSHKAEKFRGRVIGATNQDLASLRRQEKFREDFYYRLCSDVIVVPPLRQRIDEDPGEIRVILDFILERILGQVSGALLDEIGSYIIDNQPEDYPWPGNIRELEQCARQILLHRTYTWQSQVARDTDPLLEGIGQGSLTARQLLAHYCRRLHEKLGTYEAVANATGLDRRTVKKHIQQQNDNA